MAITTYRDIIGNNSNLAPSQLVTLGVPNKNSRKVADLLSRKISFSDNGNEVGSINYISKSPKYFIRAKALQSESFLPFITNKTSVPIRPQVFDDFGLKKGDILISKDSNIGEVVILDKDLPNHTISGALYKLPLQDNKYYILAFLKHKYFLNQLDLLVPKGSTIRHAKTLFLDCKIPFPTQKNAEDIIKYVELLTQAIISKEKEIRKKHKQILEKIENELFKNQNNIQFKYIDPNYKELEQHLRLDVGLYAKKYKKLKFIVNNYKHGQKNIFDLGFNIKRGQNLQVSCIGKSVYSKFPKKGFYKLITSTDLTNIGTHEEYRYLGNAKKLSLINHGDIMFSATGQAHTSVGKTCIFIDPPKKLTSNINSFFFYKDNFDLTENLFIACFFAYLKEKGYFVEIIGRGNGGSFTEKHLPFMNIPNFPKSKQQEITSLYHKQIVYPRSLDSQNFSKKDSVWNVQVGIIEIDKSMKKLKKHLNTILDKIVENKTVNIIFEFDI